MAFAAINSSGKHIPAIEEAFATEPSLKKRVYDAIGTYSTAAAFIFFLAAIFFARQLSRVHH